MEQALAMAMSGIADCRYDFWVMISVVSFQIQFPVLTLLVDDTAVALPAHLHYLAVVYQHGHGALSS